MTARERLRADLARYFFNYGNPSRLKRLRIVTQTESIWAIWLYRFGQYLQEEAGLFTRLLFKYPYMLSAKLIGFTVGIHLFPQTRIGPGLYIGHYGGIWISPLAKIGANCNLSQGVTIGAVGKDASKAPELGDRVWVGPNAVITGKVKVASGAVVGANSMVATNIPENGVALGVPARVISFSGSKNLIRLPEDGPPPGE